MAAVLIIGSSNDPQVKRIRSALRSRDGQTFLCDTSRYPENARVSLAGDGVYLNRREIPTPRSVYLRDLGPGVFSDQFRDDLETRLQGVMAQVDECQSLLGSVLLTLQHRGARIVNDIATNSQHSYKPYQLELLRSAGLPIPETLTTNDPAGVRRFVKRHKRVIYKPVGGGATVREVTGDDLAEERLSALQLAPVLFQDLVEGVSVRAFVVGRKVVAAAEIQSTELDYRRKEDDVVATKLSPDERRAAVAAARACGMAFSGVDLIRTANGFVVLECNPSPMFAVFEDKTGLDVAGPLADFLLS